MKGTQDKPPIRRREWKGPAREPRGNRADCAVTTAIEIEGSIDALGQDVFRRPRVRPGPRTGARR